MEFYTGFIVAIVSLVVPMTWWLKAILATFVFVAWGDIAFNAPIMATRKRLHKIVLCAVGLFVLGALLLPPVWSDFGIAYPASWLFSNYATPKPFPTPASKTVAEPHSTAFLECSLGFWPAADSDSQAFNVFTGYIGGSEPTIGIGYGQTDPRNHGRQFSSVAPIKCEITFYGDKPIFAVEIPVSIDIYEDIKKTNGTSNGKLLKTLVIPATIGQIYYPDHNVVRFYAYSIDVDAYIGVRTPSAFKYKTLDNESRAGKFITSSNSEMLTGPQVPPLPANPR